MIIIVFLWSFFPAKCLMWCWNCFKQYHWHWALPAFTKTKWFRLIVTFFLTIFNMSHLEHLLSVLRTRAIIAFFLFLSYFLIFFFWEGWGTYQLLSQQISWNSETLSRGQIAVKLRPVVKSATKIACSYCYNSECVQAKWQEHISRHLQCSVERWAEKANSYGEKYYNNYLHCDGIEIRNDFLHLFVNIYYMGNLACYLLIFL